VRVGAAKKEFSIERRLRAHSRRPGAEVSNADLLDAIEALREDMNHLSAPARSDGFELEPDEDQEIRIELAQMVRSIARAKSELAAIKHPKIEDDQVLQASNELDAIVIATENATNAILGSAEEIEKIVDQAASEHGDDDLIVLLSEKVGAQVVNIFEACNFQDLTGQRINKVVHTLRFIEARILAMIEIWGAKAFEDLPMPDAAPAIHSSDELVSGPQLSGQGISQAEIDALFD